MKTDGMKSDHLKMLWILTKRELNGYLSSVSTYVVAAVFLVLWEFLFFRNVFLVDEVSLRLMFSILPWLLLILVPALTMGSVAQEKSQGTLEYILTKPVAPITFLASKLLSGFIFVAAILLVTLTVPITFSFFGELDWGIVASQYIGSLFLAGTTLAIGIFISSLLKSQMAALIASAFVIFLLTVIGSELITVSLPLAINSILEKFDKLIAKSDSNILIKDL